MKDVLELALIQQEVARYCSFSLGKEMVLNSHPVFEMLVVKRQLNQTKEAMEAVRVHGVMPFSGVYDVRSFVEGAKKNAICTPMELGRCASLMRGSQRVKDFMKRVETPKQSLIELSDCLMIDLKLCESIERCISDTYEILDQASFELRKIRQRIRDCEADLVNQTNRFIASNGSKLTDTITTTRNDRVCVLVKISEKNTIRGFIHGESASGATAYVEPECLIQANNRLQAAKSAEDDEIARILFELSQQVKTHSDALLANCETLACLDSIFAKAQYGLAVDGCVASIQSDFHLWMRKARHPLIDPKKVVANTYELKENQRVLLITGSNTGGKTVTLKTIGLFVLMSYAGFPVPADEVILPVFDAVYVDIGDEQSIEQSLSTFSAHISKLALICEKATENSLVILDELGSGTDPKEGEALAIAILNHLRQLHTTVLASTHYSQLKMASAKWHDVLCSSVEFDMEKMRPTYRYIEGLSGQSNAFSIAAHFGLSEAILNEARQIKDENETDEEKITAKLNETLSENLQLREQLMFEKQIILQEKEALLNEKSQFAVKKESLFEEARQQAAEIIEDAKNQSQEIIETMKSSGQVKYHELLEMKQKLNELEPEEVMEESEEEFAVGDAVLVKKYNYYGEVLEVKPKYMFVLANGIKMKLLPADCTKTNKVKPKKVKTQAVKQVKRVVSLECNVIGERVVEAIAIIDKYLDSARVANLRNVRLIHGVGTGALRVAIWDYLKKNKHVESYRIGGEGEGGSGATVVTLKNRSSNNGK